MALSGWVRFTIIISMEKEQLITWLRDAHAMERNTETVLAQHLQEARDYPDLAAQLELHLRQTREHSRNVEDCLTNLGATASLVKDSAAGMMGMMQGLSTGVFRDGQVKNALSLYAMEHFEIACYSSLIAVAEDAGLVDVAHACSDILREEAAMANWLEEKIPQITRTYIVQLSATARNP